MSQPQDPYQRADQHDISDTSDRLYTPEELGAYAAGQRSVDPLADPLGDPLADPLGDPLTDPLGDQHHHTREVPQVHPAAPPAPQFQSAPQFQQAPPAGPPPAGPPQANPWPTSPPPAAPPVQPPAYA
ncbi:hypothetical protein IBJ60_10300, partial [Nocardioides sp. zg-578]|nr:hypothetical protein [Nocardioides marmotae]MTB84714.1 hypothetical protein [Nocardioides marmotae]